MALLNLAVGAVGLAVRGAAAVAGPPVKAAAGLAWRNKESIAKAGWGATKMAAKTARFALEHPGLVAGGVGAAYGINAFLDRGNESPMLDGIQMKTSVNQQAAAADEMTGGTGKIGTGMVGSGSQMQGEYQRNLAMSTGGLVQGLYRGRHG